MYGFARVAGKKDGGRNNESAEGVCGVTTAVPGAGKTWVMRQLCSDRPTLFVAYNAQLAAYLRETRTTLCV